MASERQVSANRRNGLKGGVKTEEGKAISRLNARKHSIFVTALTAEDSEEVCGYEDQLIASLRPVGRVEEMLVEKVALTWLRIQRCARAEAEYHIHTWEKPEYMVDSQAYDALEKRRRYEMRAVPFKEEVFERMVKLIDLYDARLTNQFLKLLHEIERLQLVRKGESGTAAAQSEGESSGGAAEAGNGEKPPTAGADSAPAPADTETSSPDSQPLSFAPPAEQAEAPAIEQSQEAAAQGANAEKPI